MAQLSSPANVKSAEGGWQPSRWPMFTTLPAAVWNFLASFSINHRQSVAEGKNHFVVRQRGYHLHRRLAAYALVRFRHIAQRITVEEYVVNQQQAAWLKAVYRRLYHGWVALLGAIEKDEIEFMAEGINIPQVGWRIAMHAFYRSARSVLIQRIIAGNVLF